MVKTISVSLIFMPPDRDSLSLFGRGVRNLHTPAEVDIHPRTPLGGKADQDNLTFGITSM